MQWLETAKEMYEYSCSHGFGTGIGRKSGLRNFEYLRTRLEKDEKVFLTFIALHDFRSMSCHKRNFAYALTNQRLVMAQVRFFWRYRFQAIPLNQIRSIGLDYDRSVGVMHIYLENDTLSIGMYSEIARALGEELSRQLPRIQALAHSLEPASASTEDTTTTDESRKEEFHGTQ